MCVESDVMLNHSTIDQMSGVRVTSRALSLSAKLARSMWIFGLIGAWIERDVELENGHMIYHIMESPYF